MHTIPSRSAHAESWSLLSADEQAHVQRVQMHIGRAIHAAGGWLDFAQFMELALYAPGLGYYSAGAHKLGAGGDFTTAPELSPLFSRCVARQCAQVLQHVPQGNVLELGAGSGVMALEMLRELQRLDAVPESYRILEVSADLRARQQALLHEQLPELAQRVVWLEALPENFQGVIIANEVLDAMPVQRFVMRGRQVHALGVGLTDAGLAWRERPADAALSQRVASLQAELGVQFPEGYSSEINMALPGWLQSLAIALQRGVMLFIDYGYAQRQYYSVERAQGTLSCFFRHRMHDDPLLNPGLQDITTWVDFTAVAESGLAAGLELKGFATQAHFLIGCGLQQLLGNLSDCDDAHRWRLSQQVQKLTLPGEMGENFKAMAFARDCDLELCGFAFRDLRDRL